MNFECHIPTTIIYGKGSRLEAARQMEKMRKKRVLLVSDRFFEDTGKVDEMMKAMKEKGITPFIYSDIAPEPDLKTAQAAFEVYCKSGCEAVVSLGGGSVIDVGKAVAVMATNEEDFRKFNGYFLVPNRGVFHVAIPTTAGTGTEATRVATIRDEGVKMTCFDDAFMPDVAIVDYELSMTMPPRLTAMVGMDALAHAIEAFISAKANPVADMYALLAIELISNSIVTVYNEPDNENARKDMMMGSNYAGIAISNSSVCAIHAMAYPLGVRFGMKHGAGHAILLPLVTEYSIGSSPARYAAIARAMNHAPPGLSEDDLNLLLVERLRELNVKLDIPSPREWGVKKENFMGQIGDMVDDAISTGTIDDNPRVFTTDEIARIYELLYDYQ
ncbi:iron-containing alcohol dehydrogenase [Christensenellaceae bacterium OttesenSCG-928-K19]|nr:iron-containing alcohol dehydrogenase [Christensenellaceae bacterium OttesenSCG-928-K19]